MFWVKVAEKFYCFNVIYFNKLSVPKAYKIPEFLEELRAILTEQGTVSLECKVVGE